MNKQTIKYPKAQKLEMRQIADIISGPGEKEVYRQTRSRRSGLWNFPKKLRSDGKWCYIRNSKYVISTLKNGQKHTAFAIWRMWAIKDKVRKEGKQIWKAQMYSIYTKRYTIFYLICRKIHHSISGVF